MLCIRCTVVCLCVFDCFAKQTKTNNEQRTNTKNLRINIIQTHKMVRLVVDLVVVGCGEVGDERPLLVHDEHGASARHCVLTSSI